MLVFSLGQVLVVGSTQQGDVVWAVIVAAAVGVHGMMKLESLPR